MTRKKMRLIAATDKQIETLVHELYDLRGIAGHFPYFGPHHTDKTAIEDNSE